MSLIVILGPTASGKSELAVLLAESLHGVVINYDAMQLYEDLHIITNRPDDSMRRRVPHFLDGYRKGDEVASAVSWSWDAALVIAAVIKEGRIPILCGGSGLYIRTLLHGIDEMPEIEETARVAARLSLKQRGAEVIHRQLRQLDEEIVADIHPNDSQRIARAWEVFLSKGRSLPSYRSNGKSLQFLEEASHFVIALQPPREHLHGRIEQRTTKMMRDGALQEIIELREKKYDAALPIMKALGVPALSSYLDGMMSEEDAIQAWVRATKQYARRQMTWMRHQKPHIHHVISEVSEASLDDIQSLYHRKNRSKSLCSLEDERDNK